jgi:hypothetical protein
MESGDGACGELCEFGDEFDDDDDDVEDEPDEELLWFCSINDGIVV